MNSQCRRTGGSGGIKWIGEPANLQRARATERDWIKRRKLRTGVLDQMHAAWVTWGGSNWLEASNLCELERRCSVTHKSDQTSHRMAKEAPQERTNENRTRNLGPIYDLDGPYLAHGGPGYRLLIPTFPTLVFWSQAGSSLVHIQDLYTR